MVSSDLSDEDFLESLEISLDEVNVTVDADTHASVTGVYAQMKDMGCIGGIVLAETIRSLDRAALGFDDWTVSPIILQKGSITQVWLKDHLQVVATPTLLLYNPSQYRMRRILITHPSTDAWTSWLIELGPNKALHTILGTALRAF
ncbi:hypothetical protein JCGZ_10463 [Jatropha curcas]|uniref:Uncharacterized protein n=1 Tax=Jatropha curcas TaxID=180498 RepID=A0A067KVX0_JATCU|nr:hypothetical protein JCGZ_10463 [Jatropha curcas]